MDSLSYLFDRAAHSIWYCTSAVLSLSVFRIDSHVIIKSILAKFRGIAAFQKCPTHPGELRECVSPNSVNDDTSSAPCHRQELGHYVIMRNRAPLLYQLASILFEYYHCEGPVHLLNAVEQLYKAHMELVTICDAPRLPEALAYLGDVAYADYELNHNLHALADSIRSYEAALSSSEPDSSYHISIEVALARAIYHRYESYGNEDDCRASINMLHAARLRVHDNPSDEAWILTMIGLLTTRRSFEIQFIVIHPTCDALQETLSYLTRLPRKAIMPQSRFILSLIAEANLNRLIFRRCGSEENLHRANSVIEFASHLHSNEAEVTEFQRQEARLRMEHAAYLHFEANAQTAIYRKYVDSVLDSSLRSHSTALAKRNSHVSWVTLHFWAVALMSQASDCNADRREDIEGIELAIATLKQLVSLCPANHVMKPHIFNHLVYATGTYFQLSGQAGALDDLITSCNPMPSYLLDARFVAGNLAEAILYRALIMDHTSAKVYIDQAIDLCYHRKEIICSREVNLDNDEYTTIISQLITASRIQSRMGYEPLFDVETMARLAHETLVRTPIKHNTQTRTLLLLAQMEALVHQARKHRDNTFLVTADHIWDEGFRLHDIAQSAARADLWAARADIWVARSDLQGKDPLLLASAWEMYERAVLSTSGRTLERFQACIRWGSQATERGYPQDALKAYLHAIKILPSVVFVGESVLQRIEALRQVNGLAATSVATALEIGDIPLAVNFLEETRGIVWLQSSAARAPDVHKLPTSLRDSFMGAASNAQESERLTVPWTDRRRKAEQLETSINSIRQLPGFERFLLPPLIHEIAGAVQSKGGIAIIIVPSTLSCDVIILGMPQGPSHLRLSHVNMALLRELSRTFGVSCSSAREIQRNGSHSRKIQQNSTSSSATDKSHISLLVELWTSLVRPIVEELDMKDAPHPRSRKRVWWCPIGPLSSLPLHAAGTYDGSSSDHLGRYFVSSYAPTLTALHRLLSNPSDLADWKHRSPSLLLVAQTNSGNSTPIPEAQAEIDLVRAILPSPCITNSLAVDGVTVAAALDGVKHANILHFACHGYQDQDNPLNSGFDLRDGRLTLGQLMHVNIPHAQFAYLSACESAGIDESRPDEGLNLAGAMIFAGFKSVIGTMWEMDDIDGPFMAERVYTRIFRDGTLDMSAIPYAVDDAVRELRESGVSPSRWATYVHFGA